MSLQTMAGSRFVAVVREDVDIWDAKLNLVSELMDEWLTFQRNWSYLETIFSAPDIQKQMPMESKVLILIIFRDNALVSESSL
jgi:dynein heavy chain